MIDLPPILDKPWVGNLLGIAILAKEDPNLTALAAAAVGIGLYKRSALLSIVAYYGGYAAMITVNTVANAIGNGFGGHAYSLAQVFTTQPGRNGRNG